MTLDRVGIRWTSVYSEVAGAIRLEGRSTESTHECRRYFQQRLRQCVRDATSTVRLADELADHIANLESTGFGVDEIRNVAHASEMPTPWQIGEVLAQELLRDLEKAHFPWPPTWDNRTSTASLPGSDLVGFIGDDGAEQFAFGEAKTSDATNVQTSVIYGDDGLRAQIDHLMTSAQRRVDLIGWLHVRAQGSEWESIYHRALLRFCENPSKATIIAVLLRSKDINKDHLQPVHNRIRDLTHSYNVLLLAFYFPIAIEKWCQAIEGTEDEP